MDSLPYCICFDDKYKNTGYNISLRNFCYPIRKDRNIKLTNDEEKFNHILGGLRSKIESYFAELGSIFTRFSGQCKIRITDKKIYNIQLKLAIVLLNIKYFNDLFQIEDNNHYNKWRLENFDYSYSENRELNSDISLKTVFKIDEINDIKNLQLNFLNNLTIDNDDIAESFMNIDDNLDDTNLQIKWRNYGKEHNSWVKECDFNEIDTIREYWTSISRKNIEQSSQEDKKWSTIPAIDRQYYQLLFEEKAYNKGFNIYLCKDMWLAKNMLQEAFKTSNYARKRREEKSSQLDESIQYDNEDFLAMSSENEIGSPIQENVFTGSLPETEELSVESAPVVRLVRRRANN
ncbi:hypothetical protein MFLAVUS_011340 [Mucor flavus]|uniref:Chromo domain-containing protein n=1 Tax=Mucor flavus TaxID=439312 RepID=A0ABP9ZF87_9FUNG